MELSTERKNYEPKPCTVPHPGVHSHRDLSCWIFDKKQKCLVRLHNTINTIYGHGHYFKRAIRFRQKLNTARVSNPDDPAFAQGFGGQGQPMDQIGHRQSF